ncbi:PspA/IM30 family protein [Thiorhodovibrio frisius]|uniref:Phage shock protein A (IM30), suppresses sigma54-dependent transcription n=1 Tax=Thiorhodovibrio frisius TaxID=631362 RepID=H8Z457_9GAMM|nr:PspA/IM30 family protein [Thiorhodovibrio frisius]EIC20126.1 phage shock protein A (IM30), suppresses sigma54-dependent transcription [Thiorhodovibrio frisius]WPL20860.1 phage shock protein A [Thiorhodovibrio frisius]
MSLFKRFTVAVSTRLDRLVGDIENHDAVVEVGIRDSRRLFAQAKVRHQRLCRDGESLRQRLEGLREDERSWRERALACEPTPAGEDKALQCLRRAHQAARQVASLEQTWQQHQMVERRLAAEIDSLRERVAQLEHRRSLMRSREATATAAVRLHEIDRDPALDLDDTFERWEIRLTEAEMTVDSAVDSDPFEAEFVAAEERDALQAELQALRREQQSQVAGASLGGGQ